MKGQDAFFWNRQIYIKRNSRLATNQTERGRHKVQTEYKHTETKLGAKSPTNARAHTPINPFILTMSSPMLYPGEG